MLDAKSKRRLLDRKLPFTAENAERLLEHIKALLENKRVMVVIEQRYDSMYVPETDTRFEFVKSVTLAEHAVYIQTDSYSYGLTKDQNFMVCLRDRASFSDARKLMFHCRPPANDKNLIWHFIPIPE